MDREDRLRLELREQAERIRVGPELRERVQSRVRRGGFAGRRAFLTAAAAVFVALALVAAGLFGTGRQDVVGPGDDDYFPAFWPVSTHAEAREIQARVDAGEDEWRTAPEAVVEAFAREFLGWERLEAQLVAKNAPGSATASVSMRPWIGETRESEVLGAEHRVSLATLPEGSAWFVAAIVSDNIVLAAPRGDDVVSSPMGFSGTGRAYEGNIVVEVRDDNGVTLHSGNVQAGAMEHADFEDTIAFAEPTAGAGVLILTGDTGADGPPPDWTIARVRFSSSDPVAVEDDYFPAFWPASTQAEARDIQARVDAGEDEWLRSPERVAEEFARQHLRWQVHETTLYDTRQDPVDGGGRARVLLLPRFEGDRVGVEHVVRLATLPGAEGPAWFVVSIRSNAITVVEPSDHDVIDSPVRVRAQVHAYSDVRVEILDDDQRLLYVQSWPVGAIAGQDYGPTSGGAEFDAPGAPAGTVVVKGGGGDENVTIVRVRFPSGAGVAVLVEQVHQGDARYVEGAMTVLRLYDSHDRLFRQVVWLHGDGPIARVELPAGSYRLSAFRIPCEMVCTEQMADEEQRASESCEEEVAVPRGGADWRIALLVEAGRDCHVAIGAVAR